MKKNIRNEIIDDHNLNIINKLLNKNKDVVLSYQKNNGILHIKTLKIKNIKIKGDENIE